jgi:hypothetical protein
MPTNLYGPNDNFDLLSDHVLTALLAKIDAAVRDGRDTVVIWDDERGLASRLGGERYHDIIPEGVSWLSWWFGTSTMT